MEELIPLINKLQDIFTLTGLAPIDLPQIVVVGLQSSGKSSVLESLVGRDFLPRNSNICTRRPLVLQLTNIPLGSEEYAQFLHTDDKKFSDFEEVRKEIERETDRVSGTNKGISSQPINLKIFSPYVVNLTLVDLPGLTKVPVGDQPTDIEKQVRKMLLHYANKENSIILAVTAANTDLATSDALNIARECDPDGRRTLGVITKLDLMDAGTDARKILNGEEIPLQLGYVGVVNRSQRDINEKKPIREAIALEQKFFENHEAYRDLASRQGTGYLGKKLSKILIQHIKACLPAIKEKVTTMLTSTLSELNSFGHPLFNSTRSQGAKLLQLLTDFSSNFGNAIEGKSHQISTTELFGGARINFTFEETFGKELDDIQPFDGLSDDDVKVAIRNAQGPTRALFVPQVAFEVLTKKQICRLEAPSLRCVELVHEELQRIMSLCETPDLKRFPELRERVGDTVSQLFAKRLVPTNTFITSLIEIQLAHINTNHPDFLAEASPLLGGPRPQDGDAQPQDLQQQQQQLQQQQLQPQQQQQQMQQHAVSDPLGAHTMQQQRTAATPQQRRQPPPQESNYLKNFFLEESPNRSAAPSPPPQQQQQQQQVIQPQRPKLPSSSSMLKSFSDREQYEIAVIRDLLNSYFSIVRKSIKDSVPKAIMHFLVNACKDKMQNELVTELYREDLFDELLTEDADAAKRRVHCEEKAKVLRKAVDVLGEIHAFR